MRRLERGASYVPLIIVVVLLLIAVVWAYVKQDEAAKLKTQVATYKKDAATQNLEKRNLLGYLRELAQPVGFPITQPTAKMPSDYRIDKDAVGKFVKDNVGALENTYVVKVPVSGYTEDKNGGFKVQEAAKGNVEIRYVNTAAIPSSMSLQELYGTMDSAMQRMLFDITRLAKQNSADQIVLANQRQASTATVAQKDQEIANLRSQKDALEQAKANSERDLNKQISDLTGQVRAKENELSKLQESTKAQISNLQTQLLASQQEVRQAKALKRAVAAPGPDGQVLAVTDDEGTAILDRGKADHLGPGTTFDVYSLGKGATKIHKGVVTVLSVGVHQANARIVKLDNPMNPIVKGDYFESDTYNPKQILHFYLLGRMTKYGKTEAATRLEQLGQVVDSKVGVDTNYLVMGTPQNAEDNLRETDAYKTAKELGITIIPESQLSRFLNY